MGRESRGQLKDPAAAVLGVEGRQVGQAFQQVRGDRDLTALARLVARGPRADAERRRLLVEPEVGAAQGQRLGDPESGP